MTVRFVDFAEGIDVDKNDGVARTRACGRTHGRPELRAVEQAREHVVRLLILDAFELPALLHVVGEKRRQDVDINVIARTERHGGRVDRCK